MSATSPNGFRRGLLFTSSGSIINLVLLAVETVVAARLLPVSIYGIYILLQTVVQFLMMAIDCGCQLAVTQLISGGDRARQESVVASALTFRIATLVAVAVLLWLCRGLVSLVDSSPDLATYVMFCPVMLATASLDELLYAMLQGFQAYRAMTTAQVARGLLRVVLTVLLLTVFHLGIVALVTSWTVSFAVSTVYQFWKLPNHAPWRARWSTLLELLRFGSALQATRFLGFGSARLHVTLLAALAGVNSVAFYSAGSRIPDALRTLSDSYFRVYFPTVTNHVTAGRQKAAIQIFERSLRLISFFGALGAVVATAFSREIITLLFTSKYAIASPIFALLMIALHMTVLVNVLGYTLTAAGQPQRSLVVTLVRTAVSAAGDLLLIPPLGAVGAAWAAIVGSYASNPAGVRLVRTTQFPVNVAPFVKQTVFLALCATLGWWVQPDSLVASIACKVVLVGVFIALSLRFSTVTLDDFALVAGDRLRRPVSEIATVASVGVLEEAGG